MTESEMLEAEKYWCENCSNWDKEQVQMDGYAKCKLTGTLCFAQESGKECKFFDIPEENVIVTPCKVGGVVYSIGDCINRPEKLFITALHQYKKYISFSALSRSQRKYVFEEDEIGKTVFLTKEEAEAHLRKEDEGK